MKLSSRLPRSLSACLLALTLCLDLNAAASPQKRRSQPTRVSVPALQSKSTGALKVITGQPDSVVFINNVRHGATNDKGELDLTRVFSGSFPVRVRTVGYVDWIGSALIVAGSSRTLRVTQQSTTDQATLNYQGGDALRDKGRNKDAVEEYKQALAVHLNYPEAHIAMARSLITLQDFQEAEKQIQAAIKSAGSTAIEAQTVLANLRRNQGLVDESIIEYRKALR